MTPQYKYSLKRRVTITKIIDLPNEIWRPCPKYTNYWASNFGRIKTNDTYKVDKNDRKIFIYGRILAQNRPPSKRGTRQDYWKVSVNQKRVSVHILVCNAFHPNPENKREVNHIDANKLNNIPENLEWNTRKENSDHALKLGLTPDIKQYQYLSSIALRKKVIHIPTKIIFNSVKEAAEKLGFNRRHFNNMIKGTKTNKTNCKYYDVSIK